MNGEQKQKTTNAAVIHARQCWVAVHESQTLACYMNLEPPKNDDSTPYLMLHAGYSRFTMIIYDNSQSNSVRVTANILANDECAYLFEQYQTAKRMHQTYLAAQAKRKAMAQAECAKNFSGGIIPPAYTVTLRNGTFKNKTPADILLNDRNKVEELKRTRGWLESNLNKYPKNADMIAAIDNALFLLDTGTLIPISNHSQMQGGSYASFTLFDKPFKIMNAGKVKVHITITCEYNAKYPWKIFIQNEDVVQGANNQKTQNPRRSAIYLNNEEMAGWMNSMRNCKAMYEQMIYPTMFQKVKYIEEIIEVNKRNNQAG